MPCDSTREVFLYYDGLLADRQRIIDAVDHVKNCPACQSALNEYAELQQITAPPGDAAPTFGWAAFQTRLNAGGGQSRPGFLIARWAAISVAASIAFLGFVIIGISYSNKWATRASAPATPGSISLAAFSPSQVPQQVEAFTKVSEAFDNKASWMLISGHASDVGITQSTVEERTLVLLRLTLLHGGATVSNADLILIPGQQADLTLPLDEKSVLRYSISASTGVPTNLTLWLGIGPAGATSETIAAMSTEMPLAPGQVISAGQLTTKSGQYELKVGFTRAAIGSKTPSQGAGRSGATP
jgi:hypothetical protein